MNIVVIRVQYMPDAVALQHRAVVLQENGNQSKHEFNHSEITNLDDGVAAPRLLAHVTPADFPRLGVIFADQKYHNYVFEAWLAEHRAGWRLDVKRRPEGTKGFTPLAKRWVVERTNAWHGRYRRNSKDYERTVESSTAMIQISNIHLMLNKLVPCSQPAFHYRTEAA